MAGQGEAPLGADGGRGQPLRPPSPAAQPLAAVGEDISRILGPSSPPSLRMRRQAGARSFAPGSQMALPVRRPVGALAAAGVVGLLGGGLVVWGLLRSAPVDLSQQGLRAMMALSAPPETSRAAPPSQPAPAFAPTASLGSSRTALSAGTSRSAAEAAQGATQAAPRRDAAGGEERALVGVQEAQTTGGPSAPPGGHDATAALSALSEPPEVFYAGPSGGGESRPRQLEGCEGSDPRCSPLVAALAADRRVRQAYSQAAAAGVSAEVLAGLRRNWSDIRERLSEHPAELSQEYGRLADALLRARDRARERAAEDAEVRGPGSPDP